MFKRVIDFMVAAARQAVPLGGIFALGWQPTVALVVYWLESVLLVGIAVELCNRLRARTSPAAVAAARAAGDYAYAEAIQAEARKAARAGVKPNDVLLFHGGSIAVFGGFFAGILLILTFNGRIEPLDWTELKHAVSVMVIVMGVGFIVERILTPHPPVATVQASVDTCNSRWALLWLLGFGGTAVMAFTGRPHVFFQVFAVLKGTWEMWGLMARTFGWKLVKDRAAAELH